MSYYAQVMHFQQKWLSLRCVVLIFLSEIPCAVVDDKRCNQFVKLFSQTSFAYLGTAKHIISITVHLCVLIKWTSQQVPQPPTLIWRLQGC